MYESKDLGVIFDPTLNFVSHINNYIIVNSNKNLGIIMRNSRHFKNVTLLPDLKTNYNIKYEKLELLLKNETWQDVYLSQDVNVAYDTFINNLSGKIQQSTAMISLKTAEKKLKPWITKGLINSIRKRDKMKFELNKNKNNVQLFQKYKIYRNKANKLIKISKKITILKK